MYKWILPSLSEILTENQSAVASCSPAKAEQQWRVSLAALQKLLLNLLDQSTADTCKGLVLAAPAPVFCHPRLMNSLQTVTFTAKPFNPLALMPFHMPAPTEVVEEEVTSPEPILPLLPADPLGDEQFCLVFTNQFGVVLVLTDDRNGNKAFSFSFDPKVVHQAWRSLGARVMLTNPDYFAELDALVQEYSIVNPDFRIVMQFSQLLLQSFPEEDKATKGQVDKGAIAEPPYPTSHSPLPTPYSDVELLQAFAHEVRTPLTTIRTTTRLLLKRKDLPAAAIKRLETIDRECTEQIDRMELLFRAAELETSASVKSPGTQLTPMSLDAVLQQSIPRWQDAASRRNLKLDVLLPQQLPTVVSNPNMLDRALTGLMENFTRSLPPGSQIQVQVIPAGDQLKLQLLPLAEPADGHSASTSPCVPPIRKAIGELLMFQPETGTISLNLSATKHLFQAIGGKLIVRQRPRYGEIMTIFLPLDGVGDKEKAKIKNPVAAKTAKR